MLHQKIVQAKSIIYTTFGEILSYQYECTDYDILYKNKVFIEKVVVVPDDKLKDIILFDKNFYFEKLKISDEKIVKMSSSHQDGENFISNLVKENYIVKNSDGKFDSIIDHSKYNQLK